MIANEYNLHIVDQRSKNSPELINNIYLKLLERIKEDLMKHPRHVLIHITDADILVSVEAFWFDQFNIFFDKYDSVDIDRFVDAFVILCKKLLPKDEVRNELSNKVIMLSEASDYFESLIACHV